jgi:hypothetical protein
VLDLTIDRLNLEYSGARGQEHRARPVVARALALIAERVEMRAAVEGSAPKVGAIPTLSATTVQFDFGEMSDEQASRAIAEAVLQALSLKLGV